MKVERKNQPKFIPIIITLDTEEEARYMWHRFDCSINEAFSKHCSDNELEFSKSIEEIDHYIYHKLNAVYQPNDDC